MLVIYQKGLRIYPSTQDSDFQFITETIIAFNSSAILLILLKVQAIIRATSKKTKTPGNCYSFPATRKFRITKNCFHPAFKLSCTCNCSQKFQCSTCSAQENRQLFCFYISSRLKLNRKYVFLDRCCSCFSFSRKSRLVKTNELVK